MPTPDPDPPPSLSRSPTVVRALVALGVMLLWSPAGWWPGADDSSVWGCLGFLVRNLERTSFQSEPELVLRIIPGLLAYTVAATLGLVIAGEVRVAVLEGRLEPGKWLFTPTACGLLALAMLAILWGNQSVIWSTLEVNDEDHPRVAITSGMLRYHTIFRVYETQDAGGVDVVPVVDSDVAYSLIFFSALGSGVLGAIFYATLGMRPAYRRRRRLVGYTSPTRS